MLKKALPNVLILKTKLNVPRGMGLIPLSEITRPCVQRAEEALSGGTDTCEMAALPAHNDDNRCVEREESGACGRDIFSSTLFLFSFYYKFLFGEYQIPIALVLVFG